VLVPVYERQKYEQEILAAKRAAEDAVRNNHELVNAKKLVEQQADELERRIRKSEQINRELVQVTDILFHDLREPIRKIETFSELLEPAGQSNNDTPRAIATIQSACRRMQQLLGALQQFVSVENQNEPVELVDLNIVAHQAYSNVSRCYAEVEAQFVVESLPSIEGHARLLSLLFTNLFDNAFKFRDLESKLKIKVTGTVTEENRFQAITGRYRYVSYVQITVSDNGKGIAEQYRNSVFDLLKKLDPANPAPGCGLAICKKIVENHYGAISVYPIAKHGTAFKILLPMQYDHDLTPKQTA
jgi:sigma-B regulation protein RsbU (phosphoserine phosphatase)